MVVAALVAVAMFYGVSIEVQDGIVHHKTGGMSLKTTEPLWFWLDIALQSAIGLLFSGLSVLGGYLCVRHRQ
jgi:hypothetical protein